jgi:ribosomal protein S18 acetylase RimI-like enzyme
MAQATTRSRFAVQPSPRIVHQNIPGQGRGPGVRVALLHGSDGLTRAVIHPTSAVSVSSSVIANAVRSLRNSGHVGPITTPALSTTEIDSFLHAGFAVTTELSLLRRELHDDVRNGIRRDIHHDIHHDIRHGQPSDAPRTNGIRLVTLPRWRRTGLTRQQWLTEALRVDQAAFASNEQFDALSIDEALHATPHTWVRFAYRQNLDHQSEIDVVGYAISGRAGRRSYLQRLAVDPSHASQGVGALLCCDSMAWAHARRATVLAVNTRTDNHRARRLYERLGFDVVPGGLVVLTLADSLSATDHPTSPAVL